MYRPFYDRVYTTLFVGMYFIFHDRVYTTLFMNKYILPSECLE